jgi:hypothetical protein
MILDVVMAVALILALALCTMAGAGHPLLGMVFTFVNVSMALYTMVISFVIVFPRPS